MPPPDLARRALLLYVATMLHLDPGENPFEHAPAENYVGLPFAR